MDDSGGVGDVASGTSVGSSHGGDGSGGVAEGGEGGRGGDLGVAGDHRGVDSVDGVGHNRGSDGMMGVAHDRGNSVVSRVDTAVAVVGLSLPLAVAVDTVAVSVAVSVSETVRPVATVDSANAVASVSVVGISLGLSLSLPLAVAVDTVAVSKTVRPVATVVATKSVRPVATKSVASIAVVGIGISLRLGGGEGRKGKCQDLRVRKLLGTNLVKREANLQSSSFLCDVLRQTVLLSFSSWLLYPTNPTAPIHQSLLSRQVGENVNALGPPANLVP